MVDLDDVQGYGRKFDNQRELLADSDIDDRDRQAIRKHIQRRDAYGDVNTGTLVSDMNRLRLSAERADTPLVGMDRSDVDDLLWTLTHEHDLGEGTVRNYRKKLRVFFDERGEEWATDITVGTIPDREVDPDKLLTDDEIDALLDAAGHPRDKAAIALLADCGLRVGAVASLRVRDVDFDGNVATVSINEAGNNKGASGAVPMTWSRGYVANWLDVHPRSDQPDTALIHKISHLGDDEDGGLSTQYLSRRVREIGVEADIDDDRLNTHNFRKSAISRWIREGLAEQAIKHRAHWVKDSSQFDTYSGVTDTELNEQIAAEYDILDDDGEASRPEMERCLQCQTPIRGGMEFCPGCGAPLTASAAERRDAVEDDVFGDVATADATDVGLLAEFRKRLKTDPEFRERVIGSDHDDPS